MLRFFSHFLLELRSYGIFGSIGEALAVVYPKP